MWLNAHCRVELCEVLQVSWVRLRNMSNPGLLAVGQFVFSSDSRIGVNISPASRQWSLSITVSSQSSLSAQIWPDTCCDVRTLACWTLAGTSARWTPPPTWLTGFTSPSWVGLPLPLVLQRPHCDIAEPRCEILGEKSVYLNVGSSHTINCTVLSPQPPDHIFWYFNGQPLPPLRSPGWELTSSLTDWNSWSSVSLLRVSLAQSGTWECRPSNCQPDQVTMTVLDGERREMEKLKKKVRLSF